MKPIRLAALILSATALSLPSTFAQEIAKTNAATAQETALKTRTFALKNISKTRMLEWLEPSLKETPEMKALGASPIEGVAELKVASNENALIGRGTAASLKKIADIVSYLDIPLQLVECDVHLVFLGSGDLQKIMQGRQVQAGTVAAGIMSLDKSREKIDALMLSPGAVVMSGKTVTFNNMTTTPALQKHAVTDIQLAQNALLPEVQLQITPTLNRDGTVTLAATGPFKKGTTDAPELSTVANVKNDDTLFIRTGMLSPEFAAVLEKAGAPRDAEIVIAVTPHVLKSREKENAEKAATGNYS